MRDIIEVLLETAVRTGEVLASRRRDIIAGRHGMVVDVNGTEGLHVEPDQTIDLRDGP
ncbi:hypothetical protein NPS01_36590 [Nocardioides psychrotolerans]|uniref:Uncharacterized protein n=1 Tax=Nocardioides psychrotolerans TaxID=1005945 RepID=A0A1I3HJ38_9ACTN|nr:hypothetical protein [Nocardioides psychrotolerans]GEP39996.1 hypothetical protein NPS01_36590 [Nocardioides psychrotolerans]SFI35798.1 hypothetical protein SAMN05216561_107209 [Nocardioides psychrotolerans]